MAKDDMDTDPLLERLMGYMGILSGGLRGTAPKMYELFPRRDRNPRRLASGLIVTSKRTPEEREAQKKRKYLRKFRVQQANKKRHGRNIVTGKRSRVKR